MRRRRRGDPRAPARHARAGFVLAEVLVAFAVMAVGLGLAAAGLAVALRADGRAASTRAAVRDAQALLARAGLTGPLAASDLRGGEPGGPRWRVTIAPARPEIATGRPANREDAIPPAPLSPLVPYWVEVTVLMPDGARASLAGLKLGAAR